MKKALSVIGKIASFLGVTIGSFLIFNFITFGFSGTYTNNNFDLSWSK